MLTGMSPLSARGLPRERNDTNAGVLRGYKREASIRDHIATYQPDFSISNWHYIGDTVEIKRGALEELIEEWKEIMRDFYIVATKSNTRAGRY
jgi:hypothetical protein